MTTKQELTEELFEVLENTWSDSSDVEKLLDKGAKVNGRSKKHNGSPLHHAARYCDEGIAGVLMDRGAKLNSRDNTENTPLHLALNADDQAMALYFLERGAKPNLGNKAGDTPLHIALRRNLDEAADKLVEYCRNPNQPNEKGETLFILALDSNLGSDIVMMLVNKSNVNLPNKNGITALHVVAEDCGKDTVKNVQSLIELGAEVDARDGNGATPLFRALDNPEVVELLLANGAVVSVRRTDGTSVFDLASDNVKILLLEKEDRQLFSVNSIMEALKGKIPTDLVGETRKSLQNLAIQKVRKIKFSDSEDTEAAS